MNPGIIFVVGAIAAKTLSVGWLASIATSPVSIASRKRFLEVNKEGLKNLVALGFATEESHENLRKNLELLEASVEKGWDTPKLFAAAMSVSSWKFWEHAVGAVSGIARLGSNTFDAAHKAASERINQAIDWVFKPPPQDAQ